MLIEQYTYTHTHTHTHTHIHTYIYIHSKTNVKLLCHRFAYKYYFSFVHCVESFTEKTPNHDKFDQVEHTAKLKAMAYFFKV